MDAREKLIRSYVGRFVSDLRLHNKPPLTGTPLKAAMFDLNHLLGIIEAQRATIKQLQKDTK